MFSCMYKLSLFASDGRVTAQSFDNIDRRNIWKSYEAMLRPVIDAFYPYRFCTDNIFKIFILCDNKEWNFSKEYGMPNILYNNAIKAM